MNARIVLALTAALLFTSGRLFAQHDMAAMSQGTGTPRAGSGTSWLPMSASLRGIETTLGAWMISAHGTASLQLDKQFTQRGDQQLGVIDWEMLMAMRSGIKPRVATSVL